MEAIEVQKGEKNKVLKIIQKGYLLNGVHENGRNIVLMHDTSEQTLKALERAIIYLKNKGFAFDRLTNEVAPVTFYYNYLKEGGA